MQQLGDARHGKLADNIAGFGRALRRAGVPVDSARIGLALESALLVGVERKGDLHDALQAVMVSRPQDGAVFDELFDAYFKDPELSQKLLAQMLPKTREAAPPVKRRPRVQEALAAVTGNRAPARPKEDEIRFDAAMTASDVQRLRHADFAALSASEFRLVERLAREIALPLPTIDGRRTHASDRSDRLDWSRTLREAARHDGELLRLPRLVRAPQPLPLLILVDVSGSMERYARLMLAFLHQATRRSPRSVFAFGTELTCLDPAFKCPDADDMLAMANSQIADYAGGTRLGAALAQLREAYPRKLVGRRTLVLLISDGLDTGDPAELDRALSWLGRNCRSILWLNPLLRYAGYAPLAAGARALDRHADGMLAIHNLDKLEDLAKGIATLLQR